jgi:hypothetical protein
MRENRTGGKSWRLNLFAIIAAPAIAWLWILTKIIPGCFCAIEMEDTRDD